MNSLFPCYLQSKPFILLSDSISNHPSRTRNEDSSVVAKDESHMQYSFKGRDQLSAKKFFFPPLIIISRSNSYFYVHLGMLAFSLEFASSQL